MKLFSFLVLMSAFLFFSGCDNNGNSVSDADNITAHDLDSSDTIYNDSDIIITDDYDDYDYEDYDISEIHDNDIPSSDEDNSSAAEEKFCLTYCETAADCSISNSAVSDENNWSCESNNCIYKGCVSTEECQSTYQSTDYGCNPNGSYGYGECALLCSTISDCILGSVMYDYDNYECKDGFCVFKGCTDDDECTEGMSTSSGKWKCIPISGTSIKACQLACDIDEDCSDPEKLMCNKGICAAKPCENDEWCNSVYGGEYTCRSVN